jgi:hypothetical protein
MTMKTTAPLPAPRTGKLFLTAPTLNFPTKAVFDVKIKIDGQEYPKYIASLYPATHGEKGFTIYGSYGTGYTRPKTVQTAAAALKHISTSVQKAHNITCTTDSTPPSVPLLDRLFGGDAT